MSLLNCYISICILILGFELLIAFGIICEIE